MKKSFYTKESGIKFEADTVTIWQTIFINMCREKARLLIGIDAFRLGLLSSQAETFYKCRVDESMNQITPFLENTLKIARAQEMDLLGETFELDRVRELVDEYLDDHFIVILED